MYAAPWFARSRRKGVLERALFAWLAHIRDVILDFQGCFSRVISLYLLDLGLDTVFLELQISSLIRYGGVSAARQPQSHTCCSAGLVQSYMIKQVSWIWEVSKDCSYIVPLEALMD